MKQSRVHAASSSSPPSGDEDNTQSTIDMKAASMLELARTKEQEHKQVLQAKFFPDSGIPGRWKLLPEVFLGNSMRKNMHNIFLYCGQPEYFR